MWFIGVSYAIPWWCTPPPLKKILDPPEKSNSLIQSNSLIHCNSILNRFPTNMTNLQSFRTFRARAMAA